MVIRILVLIGLVKLLDVSNKPFLCSGIYAGVVLLFGLFLFYPLISVLLSVAIAFALSSLYFYLLDRFLDTKIFWVILIVGLAIGLV